MSLEHQIAVDADTDIITARAHARHLASELGFSTTDATLIATAISEVARNLIHHADGGTVVMTPVRNGMRAGLAIEVRDEGPGILDVEAALGAGYAARSGLGLGLPGARRLMDEFAIETSPETGTVVKMAKWRVIDELERLRRRRSGTQEAS
jgi:serine/threonine-protein kinase RsbT